MVMRKRRDLVADAPGWALRFVESDWPGETPAARCRAWLQAIRDDYALRGTENYDFSTWLKVMSNAYRTRDALRGVAKEDGS